ncbi:GDSL esterase/lipase [Vigna angularis]|uniref:GDSL esterase/lipase n=1 Tax=Phaseolus angularis TaxID=3914 RepID=A0A8T0JT35_PHAAN|nr:GDSL esterase/lipase [Vigna angularis]
MVSILLREVIDLKTQAIYLKDLKNVFSQRLGKAIAEDIVSKSVYLFSIGGNDYGSLLNPDSNLVLPPGDHQGFVDIVIGNLTDVEIYNLGGRKFGFANVGPIGCLPAVRALVKNGSTCLEEFSAIARLHNAALSKRLYELEKQLKGFKYSVTDFYAIFSEMLNNPTKYGISKSHVPLNFISEDVVITVLALSEGFKDPSVACCGGGLYRGDQSCGGNKGIKEYELCDNVNEHLFFDSNHVTDRASHTTFMEKTMQKKMGSGNNRRAPSKRAGEGYMGMSEQG